MTLSCLMMCWLWICLSYVTFSPLSNDVLCYSISILFDFWELFLVHFSRFSQIWSFNVLLFSVVVKLLLCYVLAVTRLLLCNFSPSIQRYLLLLYIYFLWFLRIIFLLFRDFRKSDHLMFCYFLLLSSCCYVMFWPWLGLSYVTFSPLSNDVLCYSICIFFDFWELFSYFFRHGEFWLKYLLKKLKKILELSKSRYFQILMMCPIAFESETCKTLSSVASWYGNENDHCFLLGNFYI
jgi:hypothetical protein